VLAETKLAATAEARITLRLQRALQVKTGIIASPALLLILLLCGGPVSADFSNNAKAISFIDKMHEEHEFDKAWLKELFAATPRSEKALDLIQRPAEKRLEWSDYRPIFLTEKRIDAGISFWEEHQETLERAQLRYGVPAEMIVAILGVETFYGRISGGFPAMSALSTLAFEYPRRESFFRSELEQFLLLVRENQLDYRELEGSYAGAFGLPQFISSSYRQYAVDFDNDGERDLWGSVPDAIGSVANYFYRHGWKNGQAVTEPVKITDKARELVTDGPKPVYSIDELKKAGIYPKRKGNNKYTLLKLQGSEGAEYWIAHQNFYVITRYNHSNMYAMAVYQLSQEIRDRMRSR
jgi:membrane-bound lytic murein transglycosylase B